MRSKPASLSLDALTLSRGYSLKRFAGYCRVGRRRTRSVSSDSIPSLPMTAVIRGPREL